MSVLVKICGIRTGKAARAAQKAGASMLGFNFVPTSKRRVSEETAKKIIASLPKHGRPALVGVFQNEKNERVRLLVKNVGLDMAQLHGTESAAYTKKLKVPVIKAVALPASFDPARVARAVRSYPAKYFLLDRARRGKGKPLDTKRVALLARRIPVILAGGLDPANVRKAVNTASAIRGVDVAGGVETRGKQDIKKIRRFITEARRSRTKNGD